MMDAARQAIGFAQGKSRKSLDAEPMLLAMLEAATEEWPPDDTDAAHARALSRGARSIAAPHDNGMGRGAIIEDPHGAALGLFTAAPGATDGVNPHGHGFMCWCELVTPDPKASAEFLDHVLGWTSTERDMGAFTVTIASANGHPVASLWKRCDDDAHPWKRARWYPYVQVDAIEPAECAPKGSRVSSSAPARCAAPSAVIAWVSLVSIAVAIAATLGMAGCAAPAREGGAAPKLVIVGGGGTTPEIRRRVLELSRGPLTRVVVLPQASKLPDRGEESAGMWRDAGAAEVVNLVDLADADRACREIARADLVWLPGGDQTRLVESLRAAGVVDVLRARAAMGVTIGGTSAGAAAMSSVMITGGDGLPDGEGDPGNGVRTAEGLGFLPDAIVDQHLRQRRRLDRLVAAVVRNPGLVGVGIDERTALVVRGSHLAVVGEGQVCVIDARRAAPGPAAVGPLRMHVFAPGASFVRWP